MENKNLLEDSSDFDQLKKYAKDIAEVYKSEKQRRKELQAAYKELKETRDMLIQSEKLAAIGRLTAGVAHEVLNPVNIISMRLQLLSMTEELSDQARNAVTICKDQLDRIVEITKDLGQFSRVYKKHTTVSDLNMVIGHVLTLYAPQFKIENIRTDVQYHPDLPSIQLERDRFEQVLLNIISNASTSMAGQEVKMLDIVTKSVKSGDYVQVIISDTGAGINQSNMDKIFDPFFTTKNPDQGTGLGLFISYSIIKDLGGRIWAENREPKGASFYIELPSAKNIDN
ncbi:MAG: ATP-binding protein [Thermodesulfobacteriota bacterium]|nr:ATP-binding protein [Thermodesulfobacteriota bacterium]